jgi:hypothetical protein
MDVQRVRVEDSPRESHWLRLQADVSYRSGETEQLWMDVPASHGNALSTSGDAWLVWLTPLAATRGEDLRVDAPCDPILLGNLRQLLGVWTAWYPHLRAVTLNGLSDSQRERATRTASFFSGGIDSLFTALTHPNGQGVAPTQEIDDHILVWGFDIPLSNASAYTRVSTSLLQASSSLGRRLLQVVTNLRETRFREADWSLLSHGAGLAGVAHALGGVYGTVLIPSCAGYHDLDPWGSHPLTDPMMSSAHVRIVHDGSAYTRVDKTRYLASLPLAVRHLRVCHQDAHGQNCGRCNKCYRTMLALEALGALEHSQAFDRHWLDLRRAERVYLPHSYDVREFRYIRDLAREAGREDIARVVERTLRNSARRKRWVERVRRFRSTPIAWRWATRLERRLLRGWIT